MRENPAVNARAEPRPARRCSSSASSAPPQQLRSGDLDADAAAALVEDCARAGRRGRRAELDRRVRAAEQDRGATGQLALES